MFCGRGVVGKRRGRVGEAGQEGMIVGMKREAESDEPEFTDTGPGKDLPGYIALRLQSKGVSQVGSCPLNVHWVISMCMVYGHRESGCRLTISEICVSTSSGGMPL